MTCDVGARIHILYLQSIFRRVVVVPEPGESK